ncbi:MAG: hypothetical protein WC788_05810 [Candidatus Paceibacterota bacterium]|jgi:hypothetical protein
MTIKEPECKEDRMMIAEIKRKALKKEQHTIGEMQFVISHYEYFIDSEELERIDRETEAYGNILEKSCVRVKNPRAWTR